MKFFRWLSFGCTNKSTLSQVKEKKECDSIKSSSSFSFLSPFQSSSQIVPCENTFHNNQPAEEQENWFSWLNPLHVIHSYLIEYVEKQEEIWKVRLYYPHSFYGLSTVLVGFTVYGLVVSFPYSLMILSTGALVGVGSYALYRR